MEIINLKWKGDIQLNLITTLSELESGTDELPVAIREWFHESDEPSLNQTI